MRIPIILAATSLFKTSTNVRVPKGMWNLLKEGDFGYCAFRNDIPLESGQLVEGPCNLHVEMKNQIEGKEISLFLEYVR